MWSILGSLFAATALAMPTTFNDPHNVTQVLEARDVPLWAADFTSAANSAIAGFGRVHIQYYDLAGKSLPLNNNGPPIPVITHDKLGKTLKIHLDGANPAQNIGAQQRWEALPPSRALYYKEGDDRYFRFDFVLDPDYPITQPSSFNLIKQIHQALDCCGSPPIEFDIRKGQLAVHGENSSFQPLVTYEKVLANVKLDTKYKVIFRVKFSSISDNSLLEVWLNDQKVLSDFKPPTATLNGGDSYWKGATAYCHSSVPPLTVYQNAHRVGATYASVN